MSSLKKFDYRIKDNRKRNMFLCGIILVVVAIIGVKLFNSYASFSNETNELTMVNAKTKVYPTAVAKITELEKTNTNSELRYDGTTDNNLRYIGKNPNNYVDFGDGTYDSDLWYGFEYTGFIGETKEYSTKEACEDDSINKICIKIHSQGDKILWRIIGVMNNVEDSNGTKSARIKLIKDDGIGQISWDNKCLSNQFDETQENCIGDYSYENSSLKKLLNDAYLNSVKSTDYNRWTNQLMGFHNRKFEKIDFTKTGIKAEYRDMIDTIKYKLGEVDYSSSKENYYRKLTPNLLYNVERSNNVSTNHPTEWIGQIGLIYPSDYGYATSGGIGIDTWSEKQYITLLETCMNTPVYNWNLNEYLGCRDNDWLYIEDVYQWTITAYTDGGVVRISNTGGFDYELNYSYLVRPVIYLKPNVRIMGGTGTKEDPFKLMI